jgi:hypothetical protein
MPLFLRLIRNSEFSTLASFVSPTLFELVTPSELSVRAVQLVKNWWDHDGYQQLLAERQDFLLAQGVEMSLRPVDSQRRSFVPFLHHDPLPPLRTLSGRGALSLFFQQMFVGKGTLLDLRRSRFSTDHDGRLVFTPLPLWTTWSEDFACGLRDMFDGFYLDDEARAARALRYLGLSAAKELLVGTYGGGRRTACRFSIEEFRTTFHQVFLRCKRSHCRLHPDLVTFGIVLLTLTDHLEMEGEAYDISRACASAHEMSLPSGAGVD